MVPWDKCVNVLLFIRCNEFLIKIYIKNYFSSIPHLWIVISGNSKCQAPINQSVFIIVWNSIVQREVTVLKQEKFKDLWNKNIKLKTRGCWIIHLDWILLPSLYDFLILLFMCKWNCRNNFYYICYCHTAYTQIAYSTFILNLTSIAFIWHLTWISCLPV